MVVRRFSGDGELFANGSKVADVEYHKDATNPTKVVYRIKIMSGSIKSGMADFELSEQGGPRIKIDITKRNIATGVLDAEVIGG